MYKVLLCNPLCQSVAPLLDLADQITGLFWWPQRGNPPGREAPPARSPALPGEARPGFPALQTLCEVVLAPDVFVIPSASTICIKGVQENVERHVEVVVRCPCPKGNDNTFLFGHVENVCYHRRLWRINLQHRRVGKEPCPCVAVIPCLHCFPFREKYRATIAR